MDIPLAYICILYTFHAFNVYFMCINHAYHAFRAIFVTTFALIMSLDISLISCDYRYQFTKYLVISCGSKKEISLRGGFNDVSQFVILCNIPNIYGFDRANMFWMRLKYERISFGLGEIRI